MCVHMFSNQFPDHTTMFDLEFVLMVLSLCWHTFVAECTWNGGYSQHLERRVGPLIILIITHFAQYLYRWVQGAKQYQTYGDSTEIFFFLINTVDKYIVLCIHTINKQRETTELDRQGTQQLNSHLSNHLHWKIHRVKQYLFTLSINIQTILIFVGPSVKLVCLVFIRTLSECYWRSSRSLLLPPLW